MPDKLLSSHPILQEKQVKDNNRGWVSIKLLFLCENGSQGASVSPQGFYFSAF